MALLWRSRFDSAIGRFCRRRKVHNQRKTKNSGISASAQNHIGFSHSKLWSLSGVNQRVETQDSCSTF